MSADGYTCKLEWKGGTRRERTNGHQPGGMAGHAGRLDPGPGNQRPGDRRFKAAGRLEAGHDQDIAAAVG